MTELSQVLIIDDHPLFREAIGTAVSLAYPDTQSREVSSVDDALKVLDEGRDFDLAMLDLNLPGVCGFEGLLRCRIFTKISRSRGAGDCYRHHHGGRCLPAKGYVL